jgi:ABC-type dipeptide/oligopeptide/nickel transport system ATPase component
MTRILAIAGVPGVGKSTTMKALMDKLNGQRQWSRWGLLDYTICNQTAVLGVYDASNPFGGTDKLSMAVHEDAFVFVQQVEANRIPGVQSIAFEGDRLCSAKFLNAIRGMTNVELRFIVLQISPEALRERRANRSFQVGKEQDATWLRGRESKVANLIAEQNAEVRVVETSEEQQALAEELRAWLAGEVHVELSKPLMLNFG